MERRDVGLTFHGIGIADAVVKVRFEERNMSRFGIEDLEPADPPTFFILEVELISAED